MSDKLSGKSLQSILLSCPTDESLYLLAKEVIGLRAELNEAADATGIAGVDEPMSLLECIQSLRSEVKRFRQAIERHKERIPFKEPDYEDYQLWKALDGEE